MAGAWLAGFASPNTQAAYRTDIANWFEWCLEHDLDPMSGVERPHIDLYARSLEAEGRSPSTVARHLSALASFYGFLVDELQLPRSPAARVKRPKVAQESPALGLDRDELRSFLSAAEPAGPRDHALACLLALNGMRVSEACGLEIENLDVERGHQVVRFTGKGGTRRICPLAPRTADAIHAAVGDRTSGPLLIDAKAERLDRHDAARIVRRVARAAGITKRVSPHSLRHSMVTLSLDAGVPLHVVQDAAGHASPATTRRYDRARGHLDSHATYALEAFLA